MIKRILITGATSGIGKAAALELASMGHELIFIARNREKAESVKIEIIKKSNNSNVSYILADLSSKKQLKESVDYFRKKYQKLDVLINNAGVCLPERRITADGMEEMFQINHLSYFMLSNLLIEMLEKSDDPRIINVASSAHIPGIFDADNLQSEKGFTSFGNYRNTKLLNILFTLELAEKLKKKKISVNAMHPGVVRTSFGSEFNPIYQFFGNLFKLFLISANRGAETTVYLATSNDVKGVSGKYFYNCKPVEPQNAALTIHNRKILWEKSLVLSGIDDTPLQGGRGAKNMPHS